MIQGTAIWLTGLPSSGKTTLAESLARSLKNHGIPVEVLDGDEIRRSISADLGFSAKDCQEHARRVIFLSKLLSRNGVNVVVPLISPTGRLENWPAASWSALSRSMSNAPWKSVSAVMSKGCTPAQCVGK